MNKTALAGVFIIAAGMAIGMGAASFGENPEMADKVEATCKTGMNADPHTSSLDWKTVEACASLPSIWLHRAVH